MFHDTPFREWKSRYEWMSTVRDHKCLDKCTKWGHNSNIRLPIYTNFWQDALQQTQV